MSAMLKLLSIAIAKYCWTLNTLVAAGSGKSVTEGILWKEYLWKKGFCSVPKMEFIFFVRPVFVFKNTCMHLLLPTHRQIKGAESTVCSASLHTVPPWQLLPYSALMEMALDAAQVSFMPIRHTYQENIKAWRYSQRQTQVTVSVQWYCTWISFSKIRVGFEWRGF